MKLTKIKELLGNLTKNISNKALTRRSLVTGASLGVFLILILGVMVIATTDKATAVMVNGKRIAIVKEQSAVESVVNELIKEKNRQSGLKLGVADKITYEKVKVNNFSVDNLPSLKKKLNDTLNFVTLAAVIKIDGRPELGLADKQTAEEVLTKLKKEYLSQLADAEVESIRFMEKVEIADAKVDFNQVTSPEKALELLKNGRNKKLVHVVQKGDNLWSIARANDMRVKEILALNPEMKSERLDLGQEINLVKVEPLVNVEAVVKASGTENIPFQVKVKQDNKLRKGQEKVLQAGVLGSKDVTYKITLRNGKEVKRQVLASRVTKEPKEQVVARGARRYVMVASRGGLGKFLWPLRGAITSKFGWRWGRAHNGIDIDGVTGEPVGAAAAGRVIRAEWYSAYGKTVDVDHGNGYVTRYAHLSSIDVEVGEQVDRGELIGKVGTTGNATGSSLHFEIITRGEPVNPLGYLR